MKRRRRAAGEGSVFTRTVNGRTQWIAQTAFPEQRRFTSTESQSAAIAKRTAYLKKRTNIARISSKQTVEEYLHDWLGSQNVRERTLEGYRTQIDVHVVPMIGKMRVSEVQPQHIQMVIDNIKSPWVKYQTFGRLRSAFRLLTKWKKIDEDPTAFVDAPPQPESVVVPLGEGDFYKLIDEIRGDRLAALWMIFLTIGPRRGEAIAIGRSTDLRFFKRDDGHEVATITFRRSIQRVGKPSTLQFVPVKSKKANRTVTLAAPVKDLVKRHLVAQKKERLKAGERWQDEDLLFCTKSGGKLDPRNATRRWHELLAAAGVPKTKLHNARHTVISILLRETGDIKAVQELAGHSRASVTTDIYGHLISAPSVMADAMENVLKRKRAK